MEVKRHQSRHKTKDAAITTARLESLKKFDATFGVIEDTRDALFYVEEDYSSIRFFETLHGEYIQGQFIEP